MSGLYNFPILEPITVAKGLKYCYFLASFMAHTLGLEVINACWLTLPEMGRTHPQKRVAKKKKSYK